MGNIIEFLKQAFQYFLHIDVHLKEIVSAYGIWVYAILFFIIFAETGFVVTPFLPGDSLLFAAGVIAKKGGLNYFILIALLIAAAILGDMANYWIGHFIGPKVFSKKKSLLFNPAHIEKTHRFYEKYGGKTIIIARFVPIVRTFAPFVAGVGKMTYSRFFSFNVIGGIAWVLLMVSAGYLFSGIGFVEKNFSMVIIAIIILSIMPAVYEFIAEKRRSRLEAKAKEATSKADEIAW